jgi:hypothetical protein
MILGLLYKTFRVKWPSGNNQKNAFFDLWIHLFFYIPCLFTGLFDTVASFFSGETNAETYGSLLMILAILGLVILYFLIPSLFHTFSIQGGKQLVNQPVHTDTEYSLGTYQELNGKDGFDYQYAISCWIFIDAASPNTNSSYEKYTSLLHFGNKPNVMYNASTNTLLITMQQKDMQQTRNHTLMDLDEHGNRILYKHRDFLLQKWNQLILNYNGGIMDIFLNGELVQSDSGVIPYYTLDNLTIGENHGIKGGMCNVVYFRKSLTASQIYSLYHTVKGNNPPTSNQTNTTITKLHSNI